MNLDWLIPLFAAIAACVTIFLSKPERLWLAIRAVVFVVGAGVWEASRKYAEVQKEDEIRDAVHRRLISKTDSFLDFVSEMLFRASDGWLPRTEDEFFSARSANVICQHLDISRNAPVLPVQTWRVRIYAVFKDFRQSLQSTLDQHAVSLETELVKTLDKVAQSSLLSIGETAVTTSRADLELNVKRPPLLCWGLEQLVTESLAALHDLYRALKARETSAKFSPDHQWLLFPLPHQKHLMGTSHFSTADLHAWKTRYPNSPGPAKFGRGNPNRGVRPHNAK